MARPDFTGTWTFNRARSSLQIEPPDSTMFVIHHTEPHFRLERTHVFGDRSDTFGIDLTVGGEEVSRTHAGVEISATVRWDGETLVFHSRMSRDGEEGTNTVRYSLSEGGRVFIADERFTGKGLRYQNLWVFDRQ